MIKVKLGLIYQQNEAFNTILRSKLPAKLAYQMAKMTKQIAEECQIVEKHRQDLIEKYGEDFKVEGQAEMAKKVKDEHVQTFMNEFNEMLQNEVELYGDRIKIDQLIAVEMTPEQLISIDWLIEE